MVRGEAVLPQQQPEAAAAEVTSDAHRRAKTAGETEARGVVRDGVVELAERGARPDPRRLVPHVDADGAEQGQVNDGEGAPRRAEGAVGQTLVVMAAAARAHADTVADATAHGGLDVGGASRRDDGDRRRGRRRHEQQVPDGGLEGERVQRPGRVRVDGSRREVDGEAVEEGRGIRRRSSSCRCNRGHMLHDGEVSGGEE